MWNTLILDPMVNSLIWLYGMFGNNYLWSIIVVTIIIRMATFPLTWQQQKSSLAMQELQPKMKKLREKYEDKPEELQAKMMELYRENGVNPLGGCLPTLIQFPILIGLYQAITRSLAASPLQLIDLSQHIYHGGFPPLLPDPASLLPIESRALWLNLASPDPYYILPVLVVISTFLQSRLLTPPSTGNDDQASMTRSIQFAMPLFIGFYSTIFPSGLSIYWIVSNLIGVAQYAAMGRASLKNLFGTEDGSFSLTGLLGLPQSNSDDNRRSSRRPSSKSRKKRRK